MNKDGRAGDVVRGAPAQQQYTGVKREGGASSTQKLADLGRGVNR